jgi:hypothetical protein
MAQQVDAKLLVNDPIFLEKYFRHRFRMGIKLFENICEYVMKFDRFFKKRRNVVGELGHSTIQKVTVALRMLAYIWYPGGSC